IIDGVVCAFQAHTDRSTITDVAARVAKTLAAPPVEIQRLLLNEDKAVLGSVPRLLHLRGEGVMWAPSDHYCVACELLLEEPTESTWAIKGRLMELHSA